MPLHEFSHYRRRPPHRQPPFLTYHHFLSLPAQPWEYFTFRAYDSSVDILPAHTKFKPASYFLDAIPTSKQN